MSKRVETRLSELEALAETGDYLKNFAEVEAWFCECRRKYNSSEEQEKRRIQYEKRLEEGRKRKAAFYALL